MLPAAILLAVAAGVFYVRLLNGPVSLRMLASPIARAIAAELPGLNVDVEDAMVWLTDTGSLEFRLRNVRFSDLDNAPVAIAPRAAVSLSDRALFSGRIAPSKVVLIEPRLLLLYSEERGLALSFSKTYDQADEEREATAPEVSTPAQAGETGAGSTLRPIEVARTIAELTTRARRGRGAASFLDRLGMRNATLIIDHAGGQTIWRITEADVGLHHQRGGSVVAGEITFAAATGAWQLGFHAEESVQQRTVTLKAAVRDFVPRAVAESLPHLAALSAFEFPVSGEAELVLSTNGEIMSAAFLFDLDRGVLHLPGSAEKARPTIDGGRLRFKYSRDRPQLDLVPSTISWGQSRVVLTGTIGAAQKASMLAFQLKAVEGVFVGEDLGLPGLPLERLDAQGILDITTGAIEFSSLALNVAGGEISATGRVDGAGMAFTGRIGPMPAAVFKTIWPKRLAAEARAWVGRQVLQGRVTGGSFRVERSAEASEGPRPGEPARASFTLEGADVRFSPLPGMLPMDAPRVLVRFENSNLEVAVPEATMPLQAGRKLAVRGIRLVAPDVVAPIATGELTFRAQGPFAAVFDVLEQDAFRIGRPLGISADGIEGKADAQFKILVPLDEGPSKRQPKVEGKGRVTEGRARDAIAGRDVQGATLNVEMTDQSVDVKGDMLVGTVPAKLNWGRIFGAEEDSQPPVRLTAVLDAAERHRLGLDTGGLVQGDVPIEVTVTPRAGAEPLVQMRGDLTNAELFIESLAWRKPAGRSAYVQFDVVKGGKHKSELQNFRVVGDDVVINGVLSVDAQGRLREFNFPNFTIGLVSRLQLNGTLRAEPNNARGESIWVVHATGSVFDGRDFFHSLYALDRNDKARGRTDDPGLDLTGDIETVLGFSDLAWKGLKLQLSKRAGKLVSLSARGSVEGGRESPTVLEVSLRRDPNQPRTLVANSENAGQVFRLAGFYPNMQGGKLNLQVNLDGRGAAQKTGVLVVQRFNVLGDSVIYDVLVSADSSGQAKTQRRIEREVLPFDTLRTPFSAGCGQVVLDKAELKGQLVGATFRGKLDYDKQRIDIGGTYVPLQGLWGILGAIPGVGQLFAGPQGEGVVGLTFAVQGPMTRPNVLVNPLALLTPGITRELMQLTGPAPQITPCEDSPRRPRPAAARKDPGATTQWSSETLPSEKRK